MIFSSLISEPNELKKLIYAENKQIIFLISIGQSYHENDHVFAAVQLFIDLLHSCASIEADSSTDPTVYKRIHAPWTFTVLAGDSLQAYNHAVDEKSLQEQKVIWNKKGDEWLKKYRPFFEKLQTAGKDRIAVELQFYKWDQFLEKAKQSFHFQEYYDCLYKSYNDVKENRDSNDKQKQLFAWTNHKSNRHLHRTKFPNIEADQDSWKNTPVDQYRLQYIIEELALLQGSIAEGVLLTPREQRLKDLSNNITALIYPSNEEQVFRCSRTLLRDFSISKKYRHDFPFIWHSLYLMTEHKGSFLLRSNSDVQKYSDQALLELRNKNNKSLTNIYFDSKIDSNTKFNEDYPVWLSEFIFENREAYKELDEHFTKNAMVLIGGAGTGKATLVQEYIQNNTTLFSRCFWLLREANTDPYLSAVTKLAKQLRLADQLSKPLAIKSAFIQFLEKNPQTIVIFKNANSLSEVESFLPKKRSCFIMITTQNNNFVEANTRYPFYQFRVKPFSKSRFESESYFMSVNPQAHPFELIQQVCFHLGYMPALLNNAARTFKVRSQAKPDYSLQEFYQSLIVGKSSQDEANANLLKKSFQLMRNTVSSIEQAEKVHFEHPIVRHMLEVWSFIDEHVNYTIFIKLFDANSLKQLQFVFRLLLQFAFITRGQSVELFCLNKTIQNQIREDVINRKSNEKRSARKYDFGKTFVEWLNKTLDFVLESNAENKIRHLRKIRKNIFALSGVDLISEKIDSLFSFDNLYPNSFPYDSVCQYAHEKCNGYLHGLTVCIAEGEYLEAFEFLTMLHVEETNGIVTNPDFWADVHFKLFHLYSLTNDKTLAKKSLDKCVSYIDPYVMTKKSFLYKAIELMIDSPSTSLFLQLIRCYMSHYPNNLDRDSVYGSILYNLGDFYLQSQPEIAELFFLKTLRILNNPFFIDDGSLICTMNSLAKTYFKLANYPMTLYYASNVLTVLVEKYNWKQHLLDIRDALVYFFLAAREINDDANIKAAYIALIQFDSLVKRTFSVSLEFGSDFNRILNLYRLPEDIPLLENFNFPAIANITTKVSKPELMDDCHYAKAKLYQLANENQTQIYHKARFFSPSKHATSEEPFGPFSDYYCAQNDELTDLSMLISHFETTGT